MTSPRTARRRPDGRYDPPSTAPARLLAVLLSVLLLGLLAAVVSVLWARWSAGEVTARVVTFSVQSDRAVRIDLEVTKPAGSPAYCFVRARGEDGAEVGREAVAVDAAGSPRERFRHEHVLSTRSRAVTGEVGRCSSAPLPEPTRSP